LKLAKRIIIRKRKKRKFKKMRDKKEPFFHPLEKYLQKSIIWMIKILGRVTNKEPFSTPSKSTYKAITEPFSTLSKSTYKAITEPFSTLL